MGLSPTPVREAFALLEAEGLLESRAHHGVVVSARHTGEAADVMQLRLLVEPVAAYRATELSTPQFLNDLRAAVKTSNVSVKRGDIHAFRRSSAALHEMIAQASGSRILFDVVRLLMTRIAFSLPLDRIGMRRIQSEHVELVERIVAGVPDEAAEFMVSHLDSDPRSAGLLAHTWRAHRPQNGRDQTAIQS
jgi:DNA-binding GntR family transcriptional regulator